MQLFALLACTLPLLLSVRGYTSAPNLRVAPGSISAKWIKQEALSEPRQQEAPYSFTLVLKSADDDGLTSRMQQIATEGAGKWLTLDELKQYASPSPDATQSVLSFLKSQGYSEKDITSNEIGDHITVKSSISRTSKLLNASFHAWSFEGTQSVAKAQSYVIPEAIASNVATIFPLATFPSATNALKTQRSSSDEATVQVDSRETVSARCLSTKVTPTCVAALYGFDNYTAVADSAHIGIIATAGNYFSPDDLQDYLSLYRPQYAKKTIKVKNIGKGKNNDPNNPSKESTVATQLIAALAFPLRVTFYSIGNVTKDYTDPDGITGSPVLDAFNSLVESKDRPSVLSIGQVSDESEFSLDDTVAMCNKAKQLAALGTTIVAGTGTRGPGGTSEAASEAGCPPFTAHYPVSCPYILGVGSTAGFNPEVMTDRNTSQFYSGAMYSGFFPTPQYQAKDVEAYQKALANPYTGLYDPNGRSAPDLVAQGSFHAHILFGNPVYYGGPSTSVPIVAAIIGLLNGARNKTRVGPIGWAQPALYPLREKAFTDVTKGASLCAGDQPGFSAATGWDTPSGLGTPKFRELLRALT